MKLLKILNTHRKEGVKGVCVCIWVYLKSAVLKENQNFFIHCPEILWLCFYMNGAIYMEQEEQPVIHRHCS